MSLSKVRYLPPCSPALRPQAGKLLSSSESAEERRVFRAFSGTGWSAWALYIAGVLVLALVPRSAQRIGDNDFEWGKLLGGIFGGLLSMGVAFALALTTLILGATRAFAKRPPPPRRVAGGADVIHTRAEVWVYRMPPSRCGVG